MQGLFIGPIEGGVLSMGERAGNTAPPEGAEGPPPTSELVRELRDLGEGETVTLGEIGNALKGRAYGLVLLALALPELIPMVGLSVVLAAPILVIDAYMVWHGRETTLPRWVQRRSIKRSRLETAIDKSLPMLRRLDRVSRPRWHALAGATRPQGVVCILMAVVLAVPIPGVNILAAFGVAGIGVGMLQHDGVVIALAFASSVLAAGGAVAVFTGAAALFL